MNITSCRSCGARVFFAKTPSGKTNILDAEPVVGGSLVMVAGVATPVGSLPVEPLGPRYVSHFATCGQADEWRRPR